MRSSSSFNFRSVPRPTEHGRAPANNLFPIGIQMKNMIAQLMERISNAKKIFARV